MQREAKQHNSGALSPVHELFTRPSYIQWKGMPTAKTRRAVKRLQILPNVKKEQLLFVTLDFKPCKRCRKFLIERSDLVAARDMFLKETHTIKHSISVMRSVINSILLSQKFLRTLTE
jgi:hypothetical protein